MYQTIKQGNGFMLRYLTSIIAGKNQPPDGSRFDLPLGRP
jgi:hypothetical protein